MKRKAKRQFICGVSLLAVFMLYTVSLTFVDLRPIGPQGSYVAYAGMNQTIHQLFGVNWTLYNITDWAGVAAIFTACGFGVLGLAQWIKRKSLLKVDQNILLLGAFYLLVVLIFLIFEELSINYRPILIDGCLETSYPSSTTLLVLCVMPTALLQTNKRIKQKLGKN